MHLNRLTIAFRIPAYRWLWANSFAGAAGFMPYMMGQGWLIFELTDSPLLVGLAPAIGSVANMAFSPIGGVIADRLDRRSVLMVTQSLAASAILVLGVLAITGLVQFWHIVIIAVVHRTAMGLQLTTRNTLMYDVVGPRVFMNAVAGLFMSTHSASVLGPLAGGIIISVFGVGYLFLVLGSIIMLGSLFLLRVPRVPAAKPIGSAWANLKEGVNFALRNRPVRAVLFTVLITDGLGFSTQSMFPVVTRDVLHAGPIVLGLLSTLRGAGGVVGALIVSSLGDIRSKGWLFTGAAFLFGTLLVGFAFSSLLQLSLVLIFLVGSFATIYDTLAHTLLQTMAPEAMRGRIMGLYSFVVSGIGIGALGLGAITSWLGVKWAIAAAGGTVAGNALLTVPMAPTLNKQSLARMDTRAEGEE